MTETRWLLSLSTLEIIRPSFLLPAADEIYHNYWKTVLIISFHILLEMRDTAIIIIHL